MAKFFFTFGSDPGFPYQYGWVEVHAEDISQAIDAFRGRFPDRTPNTINCAFYYTEAVFNRGQELRLRYPFERCHEVLFDPLDRLLREIIVAQQDTPPTDCN